MECCNNDLGRQAHNEDLDLGIVADQVGEWKAILLFGAARITRRMNLEIGDDILIPSPFNEDYQYSMEIIKPDGTNLLKDDCKTFSFKTFINIDAPCGEHDCEEDEETDNEYS